MVIIMSPRPHTYHKRAPRKKLFLREFLICHNAREAAIRAGYSPKTASARGSTLQKELAISIAKAEAKLNAKYDITADRIKSELAKLAFSNMEDYVTHNGPDIVPDLSKCGRDEMAAVNEFTVDSTGGSGDGERKLVMRTRFKLADKLKALELLGKCKDLGLFSEKVELVGSDDILAALAEGRKRAANCQKP